MCLHLCCLNFLQLLLVLSHGSNLCFSSSSPPSIPRCLIAASSSRIFSFNFQNRTCTETLLHCEVHEFSFPTSPYSPKTDSEQESYVHFIPVLQSVPTNFRTRNVQCSCHISLYGSSNSLILMCWNWNFMELLNINFFFLVRLYPCAKFDENSGACSRTLEMLTNLISSLITNSWERFVMPAKQFKCTIYPQGDSWE